MSVSIATPAAGAAPAAAAAVQSLPLPLDKRTRRLITSSSAPTEVPTDHGCGYFDGAPWDICYACEYARDPAGYNERIRKSSLVQLITGYFRNVYAGEAAKRYSAETLDAVIAELDTEPDKRRFTIAQVTAGPTKATPVDDWQVLHALNTMLPLNQR